ncbi:MAG: TraB/GumN family protein, partial [Gammaproteobacteria bacterium]|nr:TraB/GumN family protein [Gammaproteobacteria bacterium]
MNKKYYIIALSVVSFLLIKPLSADNGKPDLWQIKNADKISYLFGSIHLGNKDLYPLSKTVQNA